MRLLVAHTARASTGHVGIYNIAMEEEEEDKLCICLGTKERNNAGDGSSGWSHTIRKHIFSRLIIFIASAHHLENFPFPVTETLALHDKTFIYFFPRISSRLTQGDIWMILNFMLDIFGRLVRRAVGSEEAEKFRC